MAVSVEERFNELETNLDILFLLITGLFVLFMQAGFAFLEAGSVRSKNTTNIIMKNVLDVFIGALAYWAIGYGFAYGEPGNAFIGHNNFFSTNVDNKLDGINVSYADASSSDKYYAFWFFQYVFTATASTIVSGAMAERTEFVTYLFYAFFLCGFVYPVVSHWGWSSTGWLAAGAGTELRYMDFAGSGIVHITGGSAAFVGAVLLGPRIGRFNKDGTINDLPGHTVPVTALGGFILFIGFLAFNGGSQISITQPGDGAVVALAFMNTIIGGSASAITAMCLYKSIKFLKGQDNYWSLLTTINGGLAGMVSMCAGCNDIYPWAAFVIGCVGGMSFTLWHFIILKLRIDDPLDAVAVHLGGGLVGIILTPIFVIRGQTVDDLPVGGIIYGGHWKAYQAFGWNLLGAFVIMAWTGMMSFIMFGIMRLMGVLRVKAEVEIQGLDEIKHGEPAYPLEGYHGDQGHPWSKTTKPENVEANSQVVQEEEKAGEANGAYDDARM